MKKAMPPRTTTAPITMARALPLDRLLLPLVWTVALVTAGVVAVAVGVTPGETGETPPESGLVDPLGVTGTAGCVEAAAVDEVSGETPPEPAPLDDAPDPLAAAAPPEPDPPDLPPDLALPAASAAPAPPPAASGPAAGRRLASSL